MLRNRKKTSDSTTCSSPLSKISLRNDDSRYDGAKGPRRRLFRLIDYYKYEYSSWQLIVLTFILILTACIAIKSIGNSLETCPQRRQDGIYRDACGCLPHDGSGARIAYLVSLHNSRTLDAGLVLLKSIAAPSSIIFIHIDTKLSRDEYELSELNSFIEGECKACGARVVVESKFDLEWGQWSMNDPTHWSMQELTTNPMFSKEWDVYINLSADTLPVFTPQILSNIFDSRVNGKQGRGMLQGLNFVTSSSCVTGLAPTHINMFPPTWHKRGHYESHGNFDITYTDDDGEEKIEDIVIHFGSQWMILTPEFVRYIALSLQRHDSLAALLKQELIARKRLMSDETFIPTLLAHHPRFRETIPKVGEDGAMIQRPGFESVVIKSVRYERMDENSPDAFDNIVPEQRYDVPDTAIDVDVPRNWGPYYLGVYDLSSIKESGALFVRKVSKTIDPNLFHILPVQHSDDIPSIKWPNEVAVSEKIDWAALLDFVERRRAQNEE